MAADSVEWLASGESDLDALFAAQFSLSEASAMAFLERVEHALALLVVFPQLGPVYALPFRRYLLRGGKIGIFYTIEGGRIFVHALHDLRQDPAVLRRRLGIG